MLDKAIEQGHKLIAGDARELLADVRGIVADAKEREKKE